MPKPKPQRHNDDDDDDEHTNKQCTANGVVPSTSASSESFPDVVPGESEVQENPSPLRSLLKDLRMHDYYPSKLSLQSLRTLHICPDGANVGPPTKEDLPWNILKQIMLMNKQCREDEIRGFAKYAQPRTQKKGFGKRSSSTNVPEQVSNAPHPMDVMQVLFMCSDYTVRQILARKLFMCRLAIPFIIPSDRVEVMLWPLRSIILEWKDRTEAKEEALVKCKMNMVAFMRYGENKFSKSSLMNDVLSSSGHATFFHKGSPCGNEKRVISNGMVEVSHFLPAGNEQDAFKQPALFFNLRGDACSHDVQRQVLMDLATVLVVVVDISELRKATVKNLLEETVNTRQERVSVIFTDNKGHDQSEIDELNELFCEMVGDDIEKIDIVTTFGDQQNASSVIQDVQKAISKKMTKMPGMSLEEYLIGTSKLQADCVVDEDSNKHCKRGKEIAENILKDITAVDYDKMKETFLPRQGECLSDLGKALRNLHRTCRDTDDTRTVRQAKEAIQKKIDSIRKKQGKATDKKMFMDSLISMFSECQESREFAMRWMQLALDDLSRLNLPRMSKEKNICWRQLLEARSNQDATKASRLENDLCRLQDNIASATCGWEHLMRELGQLYEISLKRRMSKEISDLPEIVGRQLLEGHPLELMDGDHGLVPIDWIRAVFQALIKLTGNKKILVLSVLGIQSSGKSTLLNTMFGLEFAVSAGRCTRGIYAQLLPVKDHQNQRFDYLLVLDSEGLRSQQREKKYQYDNELATLVIGLSDVAMINMKGENITEMADVLEIVVHAFLRMKLADSPQKRQCMFVHQNVAAVNAQEKLEDDRQRLHEQLNTMTKQASVALGLSEAITSFNRIISFDSQQDVVYFPDLWGGDPPMAAINQGYSRQASDTQHTILHRMTRHFNSFISFEDFVARVEDMWNGVLSDDFIFSFRNTLAAKAYIEVERELGRLTLEVEQELLRWVSTQCEPKIRNSKSKRELDSKWTEIEGSMHKMISTHMEEKKQQLLDFFTSHSASDVIDQWKSEKIQSFQNFGKDLTRQITTNLHNSKGRKLVQLRQNTDFSARKEEIQKKAIDIAKTLRGRCLSSGDLKKRFDELWKTWAADLTSGCFQIEVKVLSTFHSILWEKFASDVGTFLAKQLETTPLVPDDSKGMFTPQDITVHHIIVKEKHGEQGFWSKLLKGTPKAADFLETALEKANYMMRSVLQKIDAITAQDATFTALHGKETLDVLWKAITEHNNLPIKQAGFAFTPQFNAMLAVRTSCIAIVRFEKMSERYEKQHGVQAQMDEYKQRVFVLFENAVKQASSEITAAEYFCAAIKAEVAKQVREEVRNGLKGHIMGALGSSKRDFIIAILDEIAETTSYNSLKSYVSDPSWYAERWLQRYINNHLFDRKNGTTKYSERANDAARKTFEKIKSCIRSTTTAGTNQYQGWLQKFCSEMENTLYITASQLQVEGLSTIKDHDHFQSLIASGLDKCQQEIENEFRSERSVAWLGSQSKKIYMDLWGCREHCPFCKEPCQFTDPSHGGSHKCIQHKPEGVSGTIWHGTDRLVVDTCDFSVTTGCRFSCRGGCVCNGQNYWHDFKAYKKYFPKWDITPNPSGGASKYWQWAMCTFQQELQKSYSRTLQISSSWKNVTKKDATDTLRIW